MLSLWYAVRRQTGLDKIHLPDDLPLGDFLLGLVVPGIAFIQRKERYIGRTILIGYGVLALIFLVWLGYPIANLAFGLMLSAHVTSILFLLNPWLAQRRFAFRMGCGFLLMLLVGLCFYAPMRNAVQTRFFVPLQLGNKVVVLHAVLPFRSVRPGDWLACSLALGAIGDAHGEGGLIRTQAGLAWAPVLALAGDQIRFTTNYYEINGAVHERLPHMPIEGSLVVPEKCWFLWPDVAISGHGNFAEAAIARVMLQMAVVTEKQVKFVGKPFKRWFWRKQILT